MKRLTITISDNQHKALCRLAGLFAEDIEATIKTLIEYEAKIRGVLPDPTQTPAKVIDFDAWPD